MPETPDQKSAVSPVETKTGNNPKLLKSTLNLPQTAFPMKAGLPVNEPIRLKQWAWRDGVGPLRPDPPCLR